MNEALPFKEMEGLPVVSPAEMRRIDRTAIAERGIPGKLLMERAGEAVAAAVRARAGVARVVLLAGRGNNGGDALVAARELLAGGIPSLVILFASRDRLQGDAAASLAELAAAGGEVREAGPGDAGLIRESLAQADLAVDGIYGTGFRGRMEGAAACAAAELESAGVPVIAVDIPSGLDGETGRVSGPVIRAGLTVTMGLPKSGLIRGEGPEYCGRIEVADIGFPPDLLRTSPSPLALVDTAEVSGLFPLRRALSHKGDYGRLLVLAGSEGMSGAAVLAARAALRAGAGLVTLGVPGRIAPVVAASAPEVMVRPCPETPSGTLAPEALEALGAAAEGCSALVIGPGLGRHPGTAELVRRAAGAFPKPVLLDADALNLLGAAPTILREAPAPRVLTPHPGEMARLLGLESLPRSNREEAARDFAAGYGAILVLKGAGTLIASPGGKLLVNPTGNPGMATAGAGDVLSGIIGAFLAGGMLPYNAAAAGVYIHGLSGDLAAQELGEISLIASDLIERLPEAFRELRRRFRPGGKARRRGR